METNRTAATQKLFTKSQIKTLDGVASDKQGCKCAACGLTYTIWYAGTLQIARIYCACESIPAAANKFGVLSVAAQEAD